MPLKKYSAKRNLKKSHEPHAVKGTKHTGNLQFVIQKHDARRLHYDFRLEYHGVLLSWAVPKGPSSVPHEKRLAIQVEDHPIDYQYFEGVIPKGNYGAGTVEIWDHGTYTVQGGEKAITEGLKKGHIDFHLNGEKVEGDFSLIKLKPKDEDSNQWLFFKKNSTSTPTSLDFGEAEEAEMLSNVTPMLATLVDKPFNDRDWLFEIKFDGYRALAYLDDGNIDLQSRTHNLLNGKFPAVINELKKLKGNYILDGEIVLLDENGKPNFQLVQNYQKKGEGHLVYYVFDLLYAHGKDLRKMPLIERKKLLKEIITASKLTIVRYTDHVEQRGIDFFKEAAKLELEGIIGKKKDSIYQSKRSRDWIKLKTQQRQEFVIGGYTEPRGGRKHFGALLVGYYKNKKLEYAGHVGGGFDTKLLAQLHKQFEPLKQKISPFKTIPKPNTPVTWLKPELVCEVAFAEWTEENIMRQPIFKGMRTDKNAKEILKEKPEKAEKMENEADKPKKEQKLVLTHLDKIYWPDDKITKGDLLDYYKSISKYILPYLKERPIVLYRFPHGIDTKGFYQKDIPDTSPSWLKTFPVKHEDRTIHYLLIENLDSLLYAVNLGSIDLHPFMSRIHHLDAPDYCVIDLDPQNVEWTAFIEVALTTHALLEKIKVAHYCKTSGGRGLHIVIPLGGLYTVEQSRLFAEIIVTHVNAMLPKTTSLERKPKSRIKKVYLDYLQNRSYQTIVAPYSVRPRPHAPVSTPLAWDEVNDSLNILDFTIQTVPDRLKNIGDIFKPILGKGINLQEAIKKLKVL